MSKEEVIVPEGLELSDADKEKIRAHLQGDTVDVIQGTRAEIVYAKEKFKVVDKSEVGKAKDLPVEKVKMT